MQVYSFRSRIFFVFSFQILESSYGLSFCQNFVENRDLRIWNRGSLLGLRPHLLAKLLLTYADQLEYL